MVLILSPLRVCWLESGKLFYSCVTVCHLLGLPCLLFHSFSSHALASQLSYREPHNEHQTEILPGLKIKGRPSALSLNRSLNRRLGKLPPSPSAFSGVFHVLCLLLLKCWTNSCPVANYPTWQLRLAVSPRFPFLNSCWVKSWDFQPSADPHFCPQSSCPGWTLPRTQASCILVSGKYQRELFKGNLTALRHSCNSLSFSSGHYHSFLCPSYLLSCFIINKCSIALRLTHLCNESHSTPGITAQTFFEIPQEGNPRI